MMGGLVVLLLATTIPFRFAAGSEPTVGPSPNALFQFQKNNRNHPWLHITADSGMVERKVLRLDALGLHGMSTPDGVQLPGSMTWDRIQRIDEVVTRSRGWGTVGAVTLGLLGAGLGNALGAPYDRGGRLALGGLLVFGGIGGYLGGKYGARFRSERNWYVADTVGRPEPVDDAVVLAPPVSAPVADPAILSACSRLDPNKLFRAQGSFGSFQGYAGIAGPEGLEELRADRHGKHDAGAASPGMITWDQVDRIETRGGSMWQGAIAGGVSFGVLGALVGMAAVGVSGTSEASVAEGGLVGALYVAPVGIVIGGLTGMAVRRWVVVYRRS